MLVVLRKRFFSVVRGSIAAVCLLAVIGACWHASAERRTASRYPAPGKLIDIGGHRLHYVLKGDAQGPLVVIDAGLGGASYDMEVLQNEIAPFARVLCYDRAGYGWSQAGPLPRSNDRIVHELHTMLERAELEPPYLLVGHSMGGLNMRLFASLYPEETAGLVLIDAYSRDAFPPDTDVGRIDPLFRLANATVQLGTTRCVMPFYLPATSQGVVESLRRARCMKSRTTFIRTWCQEDSEPDWLKVRAQMRHLGDLPTTVLLADQHLEKWPWWPASQQTLLTISNNLHWQRVDCGHSMHVERPDVIIEAVRKMHASLSSLKRPNCATLPR